MDIQDATTASTQRTTAPYEIPTPSPHARSHLENGITVTEIHGVTDLSTVPEIRVHIDAVTAPHGAQVIVDLRHVEFFDCALLGLLCRARRRTLERGGRLAVVCVRPWHLRIIRAAGLGEVFQPFATVQDVTHGQRQDTPAGAAPPVPAQPPH
ncbi:STAS domain-containing protein [Streptomyces sp. NPDC017991]|uniref:STAS domain-containing protein n=1 Tax=Streptomyces sp. NPDC017991 TaxID=3365026 RepID=UPI0037921597